MLSTTYIQMSSDNSKKTVDLVNESAVQILKEGQQDFINIDIKNLQENKFYRVEYEGDVYAVEKQSDDKLFLYEVVE
jgi:pimeloyl-CoA synthetase